MDRRTFISTVAGSILATPQKVITTDCPRWRPTWLAAR
jgi:hypothetical protein